MMKIKASKLLMIQLKRIVKLLNQLMIKNIEKDMNGKRSLQLLTKYNNIEKKHENEINNRSNNLKYRIKILVKQYASLIMI